MPGLMTGGWELGVHCRKALQLLQRGRAQSLLSLSRTPAFRLDPINTSLFVIRKGKYQINSQLFEKVGIVRLSDCPLTSSAQERDESVPSRSCNKDFS